MFQKAESWKDVHIDNDVHGTDRSQILGMLAAYLDILTYVPGSTNATQHVMLSDNKPVVVRRYPLPLHFEDAVKRKLTWLLNTNIVEHANWKYSSPILPVLKLDGPLRLCVDYRKLNQVTLVQQELMPEPENTFPRIARARFFLPSSISHVDTGRVNYILIVKISLHFLALLDSYNGRSSILGWHQCQVPSQSLWDNWYIIGMIS